MVIYDFQCVRGHTFEGWFASRDACREQEAARMVRCPVCDCDEVRRELAAPAVHLGSSSASAQPPRRADDEAVSGEVLRERLRQTSREAGEEGGAALAGQSALRAYVEAVREVIARHCEDVGPRFAQEAEAMYFGETKPRNIVGTTTEQEERELTELGVPFARVALPRFDD